MYIFIAHTDLYVCVYSCLMASNKFTDDYSDGGWNDDDDVHEPPLAVHNTDRRFMVKSIPVPTLHPSVPNPANS